MTSSDQKEPLEEPSFLAELADPCTAFGDEPIDSYYSIEEYRQGRANQVKQMEAAREVARKQRKRNVRPWHVPKSR